MVVFRVCSTDLLNLLLFMDLNDMIFNSFRDCVGNSFTSTKWSAEHSQPRTMSIPRFTAWNFGPLTRSVQNQSSGQWCHLTSSLIYLLLVFESYICARARVYFFCMMGDSLMLWWLICFRYFLRKLKKVKKSNGQILAINEVCVIWHACFVEHLLILSCNWINYIIWEVVLVLLLLS